MMHLVNLHRLYTSCFMLFFHSKGLDPCSIVSVVLFTFLHVEVLADFIFVNVHYNLFTDVKIFLICVL